MDPEAVEMAKEECEKINNMSESKEIKQQLSIVLNEFSSVLDELSDDETNLQQILKKMQSSPDNKRNALAIYRAYLDSFDNCLKNEENEESFCDQCAGAMLLLTTQSGLNNLPHLLNALENNITPEMEEHLGMILFGLKMQGKNLANN